MHLRFDREQPAFPAYVSQHQRSNLRLTRHPPRQVEVHCPRILNAAPAHERGGALVVEHPELVPMGEGKTEPVHRGFLQPVVVGIPGAVLERKHDQALARISLDAERAQPHDDQCDEHRGRLPGRQPLIGFAWEASSLRPLRSP